MSTEHDEYNRQMGIDLIREHQRIAGTVSVTEQPKPDQRKQQDEQCGVDAELLKGVVIGTVKPDLLPKNRNVLYFASLDEYLAWCDSEGGMLD